MFQKHGAPALDRLQTWSSIFLAAAGCIVASKSAILTHTLQPRSLRGAHLPHCSEPSYVRRHRHRRHRRRFGSVQFGVFVFLESQRAWRTFAKAMAYLPRARARVCWMTHFDDEGDEEPRKMTATLRVTMTTTKVFLLSSETRTDLRRFDKKRSILRGITRLPIFPSGEWELSGQPVARRTAKWGLRPVIDPPPPPEVFRALSPPNPSPPTLQVHRHIAWNLAL